MLAIAHTIISIPFGIYLNNPIIIFFSAFVGHFFCDTLLHWNIYPDHFKKYPSVLVALDVLGGFIFAWIITNNAFLTLPILLAILGGNMPDIMQGIWDVFINKEQREKMGFIKKFFIFHDHIQHETLNPISGLISQIVMITVAIIMIKY